MLSVFKLFILLSLATLNSGCADLAGVVAGGVYGGLTGATLEESLAVADAVTQDIKNNEAQQAQIELQKRQEVDLLAKLPAEWKCPTGEIYQDKSDCFIYDRHDQNQTWYKWNGSVWVDPDADAQVASAAPTPRQKPAISSAEQKVIQPYEARKAMLDQGLRGRLWPNSTGKIWYMEDKEGTTFKLINGTFVKIPR